MFFTFGKETTKALNIEPANQCLFKKTKMTLREKQSLFVYKISLLIQFARSKGYELTFGDAYRDPRCPYGHPDSLHKKRLAIDLNLFKDGMYLPDNDSHSELGEYWESIGGSWGGRFNDANHYSLEHNGMR